ncbi:hypothetical protein CTI12_AA371060 [Artemisia annua]|uniref:Target of Myb protein 1 n=1 Tax=Artemisia annua TaxID=35608 RepID=A0A2U1MKC5_ARTAN|nr:hypothetical protein CTI12_AA371060 [Artemisia annua]
MANVNNNNNSIVNVAECAERATSDSLIGPDWAINIQLCDLVNINPGQAKDALKILKKRLKSKSPKIQLLALFVLETLSKNCGENVFQQIVERDILHDMVKIVKKKQPDFNVREKILILIDTWQEALGGRGGRYPQYYAAYSELKAARVEFPPREENSVPLFTPPQTHPIVHPTDAYEEAAVQASLETDASGLGYYLNFGLVNNVYITNAHMATPIMILNALNFEDLKQELIVDLVDQCRSYQTRVMTLVDSTSDEELLSKGLALNDTLMHVLGRHDEISKGASINPVVVGARESSVAPLVNVTHEDDESDDEDFSQLARRSSRDTLQNGSRAGRVNVSPHLTPSTIPSSSKPTNGGSTMTVDYLSGDSYTSESHSNSTSKTTHPPPPLDDYINPTAAIFAAYDEPTQLTKSVDEPVASHMSIPPPATTKTDISAHPSPPLDDYVNPFASNDEPTRMTKPIDGPVSIPPPPSKHSQRRQFFEKNQGPGSPYDSLVGETRNLSLNSSTPTKKEKPEDVLFKDLVDFAKAKSSSSLNPNRSF